MADQDNVHTLMTEEHLDAALEALHSRPAGQPELARARAALYTALDQPVPAEPLAGKRWYARRWMSAAAVVAALVAAGLVAENLVSGNAPTASAAAMTLDRAAAAAIHEQDQVLRPGQYLYINEDAWWTNMVSAPNSKMTLAYLAQNNTELWIPADRTGLWMQHRTVTGKRQWIVGSDAAANAAGVDVTGGWPTGTITAPCGDFYPAKSKLPSCANVDQRGSWQNPTPAWLAALPTDPQQVLAQLREISAGNSHGAAEILVNVTDALRTGLVPAKVRAVLYQALALVPDLKITDKAANVDGRTGVAMGITDPLGETQEIIVDPATGQFIGERQVSGKADAGIPANTVLEYSAVSTSVANSLGGHPAK